MTDQRPTRRTIVLSGAGAMAAALLPGTPAAANGRASANGGTLGRTPQAPKAPTNGAAADSLQPYASYWFPDSLPTGTPGEGITWRSLKEWTPEGDKDLAFNTSTVPLARRFSPVPVNPTARRDQARITTLVAFDTTSGNPSQGAPSADYYALSHWAYIDELVFWGGSSGEGIVLAPNAPVVDAAHRNGVPVLGNIFLPPAAYGGQLRWTRDLVQRDAAGRFPIAEQLVRVATAYGFDGWFVNAETGGGDAELATRMHDFLRALQTLGASKGLRVMWYDSMIETGAVDWQDALNEHNKVFFQDAAGPDGRVSDSMFLNFNWTREGLNDSARLAEKLGRERYELWAGIDVESNGWNTSVDWDAIVPADRDHVVSYGFYRPEWTLKQLPADRTPGQFHAADDRFWSGESLDPSRPEGSWRAAAASVADRSTVTTVPFASSFNTGHGLSWYEDGKLRSKSGWNQLGLQDRLPGRRWVVRTDGQRPDVTLDFAAAWRGGSSLLVAGELDAPATLDLYATRLQLSSATVVELTQRADAGPVTVELAVATREPERPGDPLPYTYLPAGTLDAGDGWSTATVRLAPLGTGTVHALGVRLTGSGGRPVRWRLGAIAVRDGDEQVAAPAKLKITEAAADGQFRFGWPAAEGAVRHYELYRLLPDGTRRFLGGTPGTAFYVKGLARERGERAARFELRAVGELYTTSDPATAAYTW